MVKDMRAITVDVRRNLLPDGVRVVLVYRAGSDLCHHALKNSALPCYLLALNEAARNEGRKDVITNYEYGRVTDFYFQHEHPINQLREAGFLAELHGHSFLTPAGVFETEKLKKSREETYNFISQKMRLLIPVEKYLPELSFLFMPE